MTEAPAVVHDLAVTREPVARLHTYHRNPRQGDTAAIRASLTVNGQYRPLVTNRGTHTGRPDEVLAGNHTLMAARDAGWAEVAVCWVDVDDDHAARIVAADNRTADLGDYDERLLAELLGDLPDLAGTGYDEDDLARIVRDLGGDRPADDEAAARPTLADRFLIPPFTVLDARSGWWQQRKRGWLAVGLRSDEGRDEHLTSDGSAPYEDRDYYRNRAKIESHAGRGTNLAFRATSANPNYYPQKNAAEKRLGRSLSNAEFEAEHYVPQDRASVAAGTSVFDPVLCEIVYRWFCPPGGHILDPWAGGSVRGLVAALLGRSYTGIELRPEQVAANEDQAAAVLDDGCVPRWIVGDCLDILPTLNADADLVFGCPPYFDLERYGDDPRDLSAMTTAAFTAAYRRMIALAAARLRPDRFAVLVVSSARGTNGALRDLRGLTVDAARAAGLALLNEAVLVTMVGSLPFRVARAFTASRVLGRTHQDVLIFVNGDRKRATRACGDIDPDDLAAALAGGRPGRRRRPVERTGRPAIGPPGWAMRFEGISPCGSRGPRRGRPGRPCPGRPRRPCWCRSSGTT
jgi:hypothetical protein